MITDSQMELGFGTSQIYAAAGRAVNRRGRARWWFDRMRKVVDRAFDWQPAPAPRPEQIWFENGYRKPGLEVRGEPASWKQNEQRQVCE